MRKLDLSKGFVTLIILLFMVSVLSIFNLSCSEDKDDESTHDNGVTGDTQENIGDTQSENSQNNNDEDTTPQGEPENTGAGEINWIMSWDDGFKKAKEEGKNVYLLLTAPSWCHYCQVFENTTLKDDEVIKRLNSDVIPVMILDTNHGDLSKVPFNFGGFPTSVFMTPDQKVLFTLGGAVGKDSLLFNIDRTNPDKFKATFDDKLKNIAGDENASFEYLGLLLECELYDLSLSFSDKFIEVFPNAEKIEDVKYVNIAIYHNNKNTEKTLKLCEEFLQDHPNSNYVNNIKQIIASSEK